MKIKLLLSYDGTNYSGWQIQKQGITLQETLQNAIFSITGERVTVVGSGRTDAGVHAEGQVAHFEIQNTSVPPQNFAKALNTVLPSDFKVLKSEQISDDFDARKSAKKKTYCYSTYYSLTELPLKERYSVKLDKKPDISLMQKASEIFIGEHDFKCFNASGGGAKTTVRTVYDIKIEADGCDYKFFVCGNGFLYNIVRTMVGTIIEVGIGKKTLEQVKSALDEKDRKKVGKTLPAKGLSLKSVEYN